MKLIDADELKKAIQKLEEEPNYQHEGETWQNGLYMAENLIDNAPTVEYPFYAEAYQTGYEEAKNERPQGEWKHNNFDEHYCNKCGNFALWSEEADGYYEVQSNFCPNCGRPMKKEGKR